MRRKTGFTIIELMVGVAVAGILAVMAGPSIRDMIYNSRLTTAANDMLADLATARAEAARRGNATLAASSASIAHVTMCVNGTGVNADIACSATTSTDWKNGWIVFVDANNDNSLASTETILRVHQAFPSSVTITPTGVAGYMVAKPVGTVAPVGSFLICDTRSGRFGKTVTISATGRANVTRDVQCN
jgi:type IV fimbrial biogenesis protein FimT